MKITLRSRQLYVSVPKSVMYELYVEETLIVRNEDVLVVSEIYEEFCKAKTEDRLCDNNQIVIRQYISPKGHYRMTKQYVSGSPLEIKYRIHKKNWFGFWTHHVSYGNCAPCDANAPAALEAYVTERIQIMGQTIIASHP